VEWAVLDPFAPLDAGAAPRGDFNNSVTNKHVEQKRQVS